MKTETDETRIAVMATDIGYIKAGLVEIKQTLKESQLLYALKSDLDKVIKDVEDLKKWKWQAIGTASAVSFMLTIAWQFLSRFVFR